MACGAVRAGALAVCALCAPIADTAEAQQNSTRTVAQVERDRRAADARATDLRRQAEAARRDLAALDQRLVEASARRAEAEAAAALAAQRLSETETAASSAAEHYRRQRAAYERALIAAAFASRRVEPRAVRATILARAAAPAYRQSMNSAARARDENVRLAESIAQERTILTDAQDAIDAERAGIVTLAESRRTQQNALARQASEADRRARQFASEARTLRELTERLAANRPRNSSSARNSSSGAVLPASWLAPAPGQIVRAYGSSVAGGPAQQGTALRTGARAQIVAPAAGEVAYAGAFRSYGQVLILNVEGGYALVFTGLETLRARTGETVQAGQTIGQMADSNTTAPELYVEVRRNGQPVDPARWLSARGLTTASSGGGAG